jgi:perosamine synthetase
VSAGHVQLPPIPLHKVRAPTDADELLLEVLHSGYIADGEQVREFERSLAAFIGNDRLITAAEYSSAIALCLFIAGVRPGDEVVACPDACLGTNMPIRNLFARPVWADVDPTTGNIDPASVERSITPRTKAILFAHWGGDVADLDRLAEIARDHGVALVEDASEAFGAEHQGRRIGSAGSDFTVFSFGPVRHITTGEGAAIFFADAETAERARWLKRYGIHQPTFRDDLGEIDPTSDIVEPGPNSYLNNLAAAIGIAQLRTAEEVVDRHRANGAFYDQALAGISGIELIRRRPDSASAYWVYTLLAQDREALLRRLKNAGIGCSRLHLRNDVYSAFGTGRVDYPGVADFSARRLCIPSGWWVSDDDRERIVETILSY